LFAGTCRFNGCIQCQQIGLLGNAADCLQDAVEIDTRTGEFKDRAKN
jgi:hypothetical protein